MIEVKGTTWILHGLPTDGAESVLLQRNPNESSNITT